MPVTTVNTHRNRKLTVSNRGTFHHLKVENTHTGQVIESSLTDDEANQLATALMGETLTYIARVGTREIRRVCK